MNGHAARWRVLLTGLARDFGPRSLSGERFADEVACLSSVLLAIALAHRLGLGNVGWAAFSAYIVLRAAFADSLRRGSLRIAGTAAGAALAWLLTPMLIHSTLLLSAALGLVGAVTLYLSLLDRYAYGWLLAGLTFAMVLVDGMEDTGAALGAIAQSRFAEVCVGTGMSILVSAASALMLRWRRTAAPASATQASSAAPVSALSSTLAFRHAAAWRHALQGAIALALIPWVWNAFHIKALSQSAITIMAVMMVPVADLAAPQHPSSARLRQRLVGCGIGGLLATGVLLLSHDSPALMTLAVCLGIMAGRHVENGGHGIDYAGTQFALAFLVVLVPDSHSAPSAGPGLERLCGILIGIALLGPVKVLFERIAAHKSKTP